MTNKDLALFEELFNESPEIKYPKAGDVISGVIVKIEKKNILVNVNNQFTGLVVSKEVGNTVDLSELKPGQSIEVMVLGDSIERGLLILSLKRANQIKNLTNLTKYHNSSEIITVRPTEANKWGLLVDIDGLKWFIPVSQLTPIHYPRVEWADPEKILAHLDSLVGQPFKVRVINVDEDGKKIIFSEKAAIEENREKAKEWVKNNLQELEDFKNEDFTLIGVAGTTTTQVSVREKMEVYDSEKIHLSCLTSKEINDNLNLFIKNINKQEIKGLDPKRKDVIIGGTIILKEILEYFEKDFVIVSENDNLMGAILEGVENKW